jgi:hypothetical protein
MPATSLLILFSVAVAFAILRFTTAVLFAGAVLLFAFFAGPGLGGTADEGARAPKRKTAVSATPTGDLRNIITSSLQYAAYM